jgi:hypothetical protein
MPRFKIVSSRDDDASVDSQHGNVEEATENWRPGRALRDSETGKHADPQEWSEKKKIRWF